ncbi:hypothetical protein [Streptomyces sp. NPDC006267]|uniref:hypothetical protein n=1 Tax=unclassified Streptomyces TaxID=2593676 RepID=UPI00339EE596
MTQSAPVAAARPGPWAWREVEPGPREAGSGARPPAPPALADERTARFAGVLPPRPGAALTGPAAPAPAPGQPQTTYVTCPPAPSGASPGADEPTSERWRPVTRATGRAPVFPRPCEQARVLSPAVRTDT